MVQHMGFAEGMVSIRRQFKHNGGSRQIDWDRLKILINDKIKDIDCVEAGLSEDWTYTSGEVYNSKEGFVKQSDTYVYASSSWATPSVVIEYKDGSSEELEMWILGSDPDSYFEEI